MGQVVVVTLRGRMAHFGTAFSNHTSKMSHRVPSKSALHGMFGAVMGLGREELRGVSNRYSFRWLSDVNLGMVAKSRYVLTCKTDVKSVIGLKEWERGDISRSIDYVEHVQDVRGESLRARWVIELGESFDVRDVVSGLECPEYPIYFGTSECLAVVESVEVMDCELMTGVGEFNQFFVGTVEEDGWVLTERMVESMAGYRKPESLMDVYTLDRPIRGVAHAGYYIIEDETYCMW